MRHVIAHKGTIAGAYSSFWTIKAEYAYHINSYALSKD